MRLVNVLSIVTFLGFISFSARAALISVGQVHSCAWDGRAKQKPVCWGYSRHGQTQVPEVSRIKALDSGAWHNCAIYEDTNGKSRIKCWGDNRFEQIHEKSTGRPENIPNPLIISAGKWHTCSIYSKDNITNEVACWGRHQNSSLIKIPSNIEAPTGVFAGSGYTCVRHKGGKIRCWGDVNGEWEPDAQSNVTSGLHFSCEKINFYTAHCWTNRPEGENPYIRLVTKFLTCELKNKTISCLKKNSDGHVEKLGGIPPHINPTAMDIGGDGWHGCALDNSKMFCFGRHSQGQTEVPSEKLQFGPSLWSFNQAGQFLQTLSEFTYKFDSEYLLGLKNVLKYDGGTGQVNAFVMFALKPYLINFGYRKVKEDFLVSVVQNIDLLGKKMSIGALRQFSQSQPIKAAAVLMLATSLTTGRSRILSEKDQPLIDKLLGDLRKSGGNITQSTAQELHDFYKNIEMNPFLENRVETDRIILEFLAPGSWNY